MAYANKSMRNKTKKVKKKTLGNETKVWVGKLCVQRFAGRHDRPWSRSKENTHPSNCLSDSQVF